MAYGYGDYWQPRPNAAERRAMAAREVAKRKKKGVAMQPVAVVHARRMAESFWGSAWCASLESHADFSNRLPRGRTYVRTGSVLDLRIEKGRVHALVQGSSLYTVTVDIKTMTPQRWKALVARCAGRVDSVVELLSGSVSGETLKHLTHPDHGMFPKPQEMEFSCTCPDWASMCKHVAAALYGVGVRLDHSPELLFTLRSVDQTDLVSSSLTLGKKSPRAGTVLKSSQLENVFGIALAPEPDAAGNTRVAKPKKSPAAAAPAKKTPPVTRKKARSVKQPKTRRTRK